MKIGVIIAMDVEYRQMYNLLGGEKGHLGGNDIVLWQCGIGKVNAAIGTMRLIHEQEVDAVVSTGLAGGIDGCLQVMDIMVAENCVYHDVWCGEGNEKGQVQGLPTYFPAGSHLFSKALNIPTQSPQRLVHGTICTGDRFITNKEELARIKTDFADGLACDMESAAIAHTCYLHNKPFLSVRTISDTPGNTDNHQQQWSTFLSNMCEHQFVFVKTFLERI